MKENRKKTTKIILGFVALVALPYLLWPLKSKKLKITVDQEKLIFKKNFFLIKIP